MRSPIRSWLLPHGLSSSQLLNTKIRVKRLLLTTLRLKFSDIPCKFSDIVARRLARCGVLPGKEFRHGHAISQHYKHALLLRNAKESVANMSQSDQLDGAQRPLLADHGEPEYGAAEGSHGNHGTTPAAAPAQGTFKQNLGTLEAFAIIINIVIGSGIFTSPGAIDANVPSPGASLIIWLVGGVLAWTGASTLAELGTAIPGEGLSL